MRRSTMRTAALFAAALCALVSCTPSDSGDDPARRTAHETEPASSDIQERFQSLRSRPFTEPLPNGLTLAVLTAVEEEERAVVELVDFELTNADRNTGFVITYVLTSDPNQSVEAFREHKRRHARSTQSEGRFFDLTDGPLRAACFVAWQGANADCVFADQGFFAEMGYLPGKPVPNMESVVSQIITAAYDHVTAAFS